MLNVHIRHVSSSDGTLDHFRALKDVEQRRAGSFIAESELVVQRVLRTDLSIRSLLIHQNRLERLRGDIEEHVRRREPFPVLVAPAADIDSVLGFPLPRGVLALVQRPPLRTLSDVLATARRVVVLEDVVDPDNVGAIFRHCAAFGADAVIISESSGDPLYRKALRSSMGWALHVPWTRLPDRAPIGETLRGHGFVTYAFTPAGKVDVRDPSLRHIERLALVFGAETNGLSLEALASCDATIRIIIDPAIDSLNVATSAALAMFELFR